MRIDRETMIVSAGASVGIIQTIVMKEYVDVNFGTIPFIGDYIPAPWNRYSTLGNILIGGICFGLSVFTNVIRNSTLNTFLKVYGVTTLVGGIMNGVFATPAFAARAPQRGLYLSPMTGRLATTVEPAQQYPVRAQGFGTTRAVPQTTIPLDKILY